MLTAVFLLLGLAGFILAALACLKKGKRAGQYVEVDLSALHAASTCLSTGRGAVDHRMAASNGEASLEKWQEMKQTWMQYYSRCQEKAIVKQRAMLFWTRTLALCAALCFVGIVL
jgi:hypothetical protein